ncbi:MAG: alanine racemase, partial [Methyloceanibacter sp.]
MTIDETSAGALLTVDLAALKDNYRLLCKQAAGVPLAAVVKADAYGLGAAACVPALAEAGAETFFVVQLAEGIAVRAALAACGRAARVFVLLGPLPGSEPAFLQHELMPVLNSLGDIERWRAFAARQGKPLPAALHVDTGMNRLGLEPAEVARLANEPELLSGIEVVLLMSHLACAEEAEHPLNAIQLARFQA